MAVPLPSSTATRTISARSPSPSSGELSGGLSQEYRQATADRVQWGPIKGMRNLVAHNYGSMSREIIWETATTDIPALKRFCEEQLANTDA